jgi:hypothetical protein
MIDPVPSVSAVYRMHLQLAGRAVWLLTKYWWLARKGTSPAALAARLGRVPSAAIPAWLLSARVVAIVSRVARVHPLRPSCLPQALAACHMLASAGREASVRVGVDRAGSDLVAHAWVQAPDLPDASCQTEFVPLGDIHPQTTI